MSNYFFTKTGVLRASSLLNLFLGVFGVFINFLPELISLGVKLKSLLMLRNLLEVLTGSNNGESGASLKFDITSLIITD